MSLSRREIILSVSAVPILARPAALDGVVVPTTIMQIVARLDELEAAHDALFGVHAVPYWPGSAAYGEAYFGAAEVIDGERDRLVLQLIRTRAVSLTEIRLKARIVSEHNVFPCPADLCTADGLSRSLLLDLGVDA